MNGYGLLHQKHISYSSQLFEKFVIPHSLLTVWCMVSLNKS